MIYQRDALSNVVCNIRTPLGASEEVGTAIFIAKNNNSAFLLTAAHVINTVNEHSYAIISDTNGVPVKVLLSILLGGVSFQKHPVADLAKAEINATAANIPFLEGRCYPFDHIDTDDDLLSKDIELTTVGFPMGLGASGSKFTPLTFRTYVAAPTITLPRFDNHVSCDFIILELPSTGGYSGGPLFDLGYQITGAMTTTKEKTLLHGIVHGTISDTTGGKLAAITPTKYLKGWL